MAKPLNMNTSVDTGFKRYLKRNVAILVGVVALLWAIEITDSLLGSPLESFGIRPRSAIGLIGLVTAPFLHGGFGHLASNTFSFFVFGGMLIFRDGREFALVSIAAALLGGLGVWLIGATTSVHVGLSGVIFAYFAYIVAIGFFEKKFGSILLSIVVGLAYGGIIFGVFPGQEGISWESHLMGFLVGLGCARIVGKKRAPSEEASDAVR